MLTEYIEAAMRTAQFERIEDGTIWGEIPALEGVWANASTEEQARRELREVLEGWIALGLRLGHEFPTLDGHEIRVVVPA
jgi:predicted RNase H-like HicB family nuclease